MSSQTGSVVQPLTQVDPGIGCTSRMMIILRFCISRSCPVARVLSRDRSELLSRKGDNTSGTMMCVLSYWRCRLLKVFFLASPVYVLVLLLANLFAENFRTMSTPSVPDAVLVAVGCVVMLQDAWFDSTAVFGRNTGIFWIIWETIFYPLYPAIFGVSFWSDSGYALSWPVWASIEEHRNLDISGR